MPHSKAILVGCGYFSRIHLDAWRRLQDRVTITALCDIDPAAAQARAAEYGIERTYTDFRNALDCEKPDFVDIVTRPDLHASVVRAAADRGITPFCQKPLAPTFAECQELAAYCAQRNVRLMVNENWRWQAWYRELKRLLDSEAIGQPHYAVLRHRVADGVGDSPYPNQPYCAAMPRFLLIETMLHFVDTARFLMGELTLQASLMHRANPNIAGEDIVVLNCTTASGAICVVDGNRVSRAEREGPVSGDARIEGSTGTLSLHGDGSIVIRPHTGDPIAHTYSIPTTGYRGDSAYSVHRHFLNALQRNQPFETDAADNLQTMYLVEQAYRLAGR